MSILSFALTYIANAVSRKKNGLFHVVIILTEVEPEEMKKKTKKLFRWTPFDYCRHDACHTGVRDYLYPMIYVFSCSISDPKSVLAGEVVLYPVGFSLDAYNMVVNNPQFWRSMLNSVFYVVAECILMFLTTVLVAYPLTRPNLKFRKVADLLSADSHVFQRRNDPGVSGDLQSGPV